METLSPGWDGKKFSDFDLKNFGGPVTVLVGQKIFGVFGLAGLKIFGGVRFCKYGYKKRFRGQAGFVEDGRAGWCFLLFGNGGLGRSFARQGGTC